MGASVLLERKGTGGRIFDCRFGDQERVKTVGCVVIADPIASKRAGTGGSVFIAACVVKEGESAVARVVVAGVLLERIGTGGRFS